ncbi:MAG: trigger factor [Acidobacteriota bacterium]
MNITVTDKEKCQKQLHLEIPGEVIRATVDRLAKKYSKQITIPGFRPGHAPMSIIKTRFHKELRDEAMAEVLPNAFDEAVKEHDFKVVSEPHMHEEPHFGLDDSLKATFEFEVAPSFELADYKGLSLTRHLHETSDEDVEKFINRLRENQAELVPVEERGAEEGDIVTVTLSGKADLEYTPPAEETDETPAAAEANADEATEAAEVEPSENAEAAEATPEDEASDKADEKDDEEEIINEVSGETQDVDLSNPNTLKEFKDALAGAKAGDTREVTIVYPKDYGSPSHKNRRWHYTLEVSAVRTKELPELDDEFAKGVNEKYNSVDEMNADFRQQFEEAAKKTAENHLRDEAFDKLVEAHSFEVPEGMVKKQMEQQMSNYVNQLMQMQIDPRALNLDWKKMYDDFRPAAENTIRGFFVLDRIAENEKIEVTDDDLNQELEPLAKSMNQTVAALKARLTREEGLDTIKGQIKHQKALDLVIASADVKDAEEETKEETTSGNEESQSEG